MESLVNSFDLSDIINASILIGIIFCSLVNLTHSLEVYLLNKAWRVNDYEELIYKICTIQIRNNDFSLAFDLHRYGNLNNEDYETMKEAINNYKKYLKRKEKREKFLNKFRRNKKDV